MSLEIETAYSRIKPGSQYITTSICFYVKPRSYDVKPEGTAVRFCLNYRRWWTFSHYATKRNVTKQLSSVENIHNWCCTVFRLHVRVIHQTKNGYTNFVSICFRVYCLYTLSRSESKNRW